MKKWIVSSVYIAASGMLLGVIGCAKAPQTTSATQAVPAQTTEAVAPTTQATEAQATPTQAAEKPAQETANQTTTPTKP